jgi:starch-binding outer membrane protein, SusD/RagB family
MKLKYYLTTILFVTSILFSCNEEKWLEETPIDFYSPENSYITADDYEAAVTRLYGLTREWIMESQAAELHIITLYTTDIAYDAIATTHELNKLSDNIVPEGEHVQIFWNRYYRIIFDANVVLTRIENEQVEIESESLRNRFKAEASFFRAFIYQKLASQFGGVPIVLEEVTGPKRDFQRATKEETIAQAISDAEFAAANLPHVTEVSKDGKLTKAAANHLLAELYIMAKNYDKAIAAASSVLDDPNYALMTDRFGVHKDWEGDVYWDMFRRGNQNRMGAGNNTEAIWVSQYEYQLDGGGSGYILGRLLIPQYWQLVGDDGISLFVGESSKYGGQGIGWMAPSDFFLYELWDDPENDIRNSEHNIIRDIVADNPKSEYYGQKIVESSAFSKASNLLNRRWSAIIAKAAPLNDHPPEVIIDPETGETRMARETYRDHYYMRLAETYLLRAEAYLGKNNKELAAADINVVRARANASPVASGDVDIDYILDERARELYFEDMRLLTLMRLGKWIDRVKLHDPMHNGKYESYAINERIQLWPIPQSEIERNTEAVLEQNPGYN